METTIALQIGSQIRFLITQAQISGYLDSNHPVNPNTISSLLEFEHHQSNNPYNNARHLVSEYYQNKSNAPPTASASHLRSSAHDKTTDPTAHSQPLQHISPLEYNPVNCVLDTILTQQLPRMIHKRELESVSLLFMTQTQTLLESHTFKIDYDYHCDEELGRGGKNKGGGTSTETKHDPLPYQSSPIRFTSAITTNDIQSRVYRERLKNCTPVLTFNLISGASSTSSYFPLLQPPIDPLRYSLPSRGWGIVGEGQGVINSGDGSHHHLHCVCYNEGVEGENRVRQGLNQNSIATDQRKRFKGNDSIGRNCRVVAPSSPHHHLDHNNNHLLVGSWHPHHHDSLQQQYNCHPNDTNSDCGSIFYLPPHHIDQSPNDTFTSPVGTVFPSTDRRTNILVLVESYINQKSCRNENGAGCDFNGGHPNDRISPPSPHTAQQHGDQSTKYSRNNALTNQVNLSSRDSIIDGEDRGSGLGGTNLGGVDGGGGEPILSPTALRALMATPAINIISKKSLFQDIIKIGFTPFQFKTGQKLGDGNRTKPTLAPRSGKNGNDKGRKSKDGTSASSTTTSTTTAIITAAAKSKSKGSTFNPSDTTMGSITPFQTCRSSSSSNNNNGQGTVKGGKLQGLKSPKTPFVDPALVVVQKVWGVRGGGGAGEGPINASRLKTIRQQRADASVKQSTLGNMKSAVATIQRTKRQIEAGWNGDGGGAATWPQPIPNPFQFPPPFQRTKRLPIHIETGNGDNRFRNCDNDGDQSSLSSPTATTSISQSHSRLIVSQQRRIDFGLNEYDSDYEHELDSNTNDHNAATTAATTTTTRHNDVGNRYINGPNDFPLYPEDFFFSLNQTQQPILDLDFTSNDFDGNGCDNGLGNGEGKREEERGGFQNWIKRKNAHFIQSHIIFSEHIFLEQWNIIQTQSGTDPMIPPPSYNPALIGMALGLSSSQLIDCLETIGF